MIARVIGLGSLLCATITTVSGGFLSGPSFTDQTVVTSYVGKDVVHIVNLQGHRDACRYSQNSTNILVAVGANGTMYLDTEDPLILPRVALATLCDVDVGWHGSLTHHPPGNTPTWTTMDGQGYSLLPATIKDANKHRYQSLLTANSTLYTSGVVIGATGEAASCATGRVPEGYIYMNDSLERVVITDLVCTVNGGVISFTVMPVPLSPGPIPSCTDDDTGDPLAVNLQYLTDDTDTWKTIVVVHLSSNAFLPSSGLSMNIVVTVPLEASVAGVRFRWWQRPGDFSAAESEGRGTWALKVHNILNSPLPNDGPCSCVSCGVGAVCASTKDGEGGTRGGECICRSPYTLDERSQCVLQTERKSGMLPILHILLIALGFVMCCSMVAARGIVKRRSYERHNNAIVAHLTATNLALAELGLLDRQGGGVTVPWACEACTFQNTRNNISCEVCSTVRPGAMQLGVMDLPTEIAAFNSMQPLQEDIRRREDPKTLDLMFENDLFQHRWESLRAVDSTQWVRVMEPGGAFFCWWIVKTNVPPQQLDDSFKSVPQGNDVNDLCENEEKGEFIKPTSNATQKTMAVEAKRKSNFMSIITADKTDLQVREPKESEGWINTLYSNGKPLEWVKANGHIVSLESKPFPSFYSSVEAASTLSFGHKDQWLNRKLDSLRIPWEKGHVKINVRREKILEDTLTLVAKLPSADFFKTWKVLFVGEPGRDAGGLSREWFECVLQALFDPSMGLFIESTVDAGTYDIDINSGETTPAHLELYTLLGKLVGKSIIDRMSISARFSYPLYKLLIGWPVTFGDLLFVDPGLHGHLKYYLKHREGIEDLCLDFSLVEKRIVTVIKSEEEGVVERRGSRLVEAAVVGSEKAASNTEGAFYDIDRVVSVPGTVSDDGSQNMILQRPAAPVDKKEISVVVDLIDGGRDVPVTYANIEKYVEALLKYHFHSKNRAQLQALRSGLQEVLPVELLSVFDFRELELLVSGLPDIDVVDWRKHTVYEGAFKAEGSHHPVIACFWEVVCELQPVQKARLLQFTTGTTRVPLRGFEVLQGSDGRINLFTVTHKVAKTREGGSGTGSGDDIAWFPEAHTCFNRLHLPLYKCKEDLRKYVLYCCNREVVTGFGLE